MAKKKVYWAEDEKDFLQYLQQCLSKHYEKQMDVLQWLNSQSLQVDVWKN